MDQLTAGPSPRILTRPSRSNLGFRLQTAMNLQVFSLSMLLFSYLSTLIILFIITSAFNLKYSNILSLFLLIEYF